MLKLIALMVTGFSHRCYAEKFWHRFYAEAFCVKSANSFCVKSVRKIALSRRCNMELS